MSAQQLADIVSGSRKATTRQSTKILEGLQALGRELAELEPL
jgi:hypothetical protein